MASMLQFLHSENIWRELKALSRGRNRRLSIAVPYISRGGGKLLRLKLGDILVVDLTLENSSNGTVCPAELAQLQRKGVKVCFAPNLHAKVILCGQKAVVSSANLSRHSSDHLDEAGLLTTDTAVVREVREWFRERTVEEVTPEWLKQCDRVYKPPKRGGAQNRNGERRRPGRVVWLIGVEPTNYPEDEVAFEEEGARRARRELSNPRRSDVESVRWTGRVRFLNRVRKGDTVIQVNNLGASRRVEEAARFLGMRRKKSRRGDSVTYLYLECARKPKESSWREFKQHCTSIGLHLPRVVGAREIRDPVKARTVLRFMSRE
jgi:PLD-like domain